jgi:hypothetical protein
MNTNIDFLVLGSFILHKKDQQLSNIENNKKGFGLD